MFTLTMDPAAGRFALSLDGKELLRHSPEAPALYLGLGILSCFPLPEKIVHRFGKTWIGAVVLAALFWWAVYELNRSGNNPFMYLNF